MENTNTLPVIVRMKEVARMVGLSKATIYNRIKQRTFPAGIPLGAVARGWLRSEVEQWIAERTNERDALADEAA